MEHLNEQDILYLGDTLQEIRSYVDELIIMLEDKQTALSPIDFDELMEEEDYLLDED